MFEVDSLYKYRGDNEVYKCAFVGNQYAIFSRIDGRREVSIQLSTQSNYFKLHTPKKIVSVQAFINFNKPKEALCCLVTDGISHSEYSSTPVYLKFTDGELTSISMRKPRGFVVGSQLS